MAQTLSPKRARAAPVRGPVTGTAVPPPTPKRQAPFLVELYRAPSARST